MAATLEEHLECPTCFEIFKDPVVLSCSHSFCRACLQQWKDKGEQSCPLCRTEMSSLEAPPNLALRNVCENFSRASVKSENICCLHHEELKLFCLDHQELVCHICRDAEIHTGHKFRPLEEVVSGPKEKLLKGLLDTKKRLKDCIMVRDNCNEQAKYIKVQGENVLTKIKKEFKELRDFLDVEEEARLAAVREEEKKKSQSMKEKIGALSRDMAILSDFIRSAEEQLASNDISFMKNFQTVMSRILKLPDEPELSEGALLDEAKHVGNLKFSVWERIKKKLSYSPVILDPNTARSNLSLSEDLPVLTFKEVQQRPENPERFKRNIVRGCALESGRHVWDVEVGDGSDWQVGVLWGDPRFPDKMIGWFIGFVLGKYKRPGVPFGDWYPPVKLQRIQVDVDMNERSLSFSESLTNTKLWIRKTSSNWPNLSGHTKMFPYLFTRGKSPLKIIPVPPPASTSMSP
nr:E3 ubiquitin-protein ligase TRIM35-like [Nerophis lumbriciformis]